MKRSIPFLFLALGPLPALAVTNFASLIDLVDKYARAILPLLVTLAVVVFFWGVVKYILNGGDEKARIEGRSFMIWGVVAVFVMLTFFGLVAFLQKTFDLADPTTPIQGPTMTDVDFVQPYQKPML